jgi:hypothetical protein
LKTSKDQEKVEEEAKSDDDDDDDDDDDSEYALIKSVDTTDLPPGNY